jgi:fused signal recognition particle receptor
MFEGLRGQVAGLLRRVSQKELRGEDIEEDLEELKLILIQNDVALETAERILERVREDLVGERIRRFSKPGSLLRSALKGSLLRIFQGVPSFDLIKLVREARERGAKPFKILFIGINGTGKSLSIAKTAYLLKREGFSVVLACSDTFRAGAIEQLALYAERVGVRAVKQQYGADPAAVAYDAVEHAKARGIDIVLIDTAGRQHTDYNLMNELKKVKRVVEPDLTILVIDSLTGNDALVQAKIFLEHIDFDGVVLTKMDADAKGGAAISVVHQTGKPILFLGTGQRYEDLQRFDGEDYVKVLIGGGFPQG